jgi:hypothetical protein
MYPKPTTAQAPAADPPGPARRRGPGLAVRRSGVHGRGVYALRPYAAGETVIEYRGEVIDWPEALRRHPHDPAQPQHTFYFHIDDAHVIDAKVGGNSARWINHGCEPNCESETVGRRVFIKSLRDVSAGEELFYDYGLTIAARLTARLKREYACHCGSANCRGTMLAPKSR